MKLDEQQKDRNHLEQRTRKNTKGFIVNSCDLLPEKFKCPLCNNLMRDPVQTIRGELACKCCYFERYNADGNCPIDGNPISLEEIFNDRGQAGEILALPCFCVYKQSSCAWKGNVGEVEKHQSSCKFMPSQCMLCSDGIEHGKATDHLKVCTEFLKENGCIYKEIGCDYTPQSNEDLINHIHQNSLFHAVCSATSLRHVKIESNDISSNILEQKKQVDAIEQKGQEQMGILENKVLSMESQIKEIRNQLAKCSNFTSRCVTREKLSISEESMSKEVQILTASVSTLSTNLSDLDLRQQISENTSYDGRILWKIDKFRFRLQQAITGKITALHSAPGFTKHYGHKFCARLYLNGDGMGKCTHVSLFFVVMKSEYDNLLEWPFNRKVIFRLLNPEDPSRNITESFFPDSTSSSFQKPSKEMNIAAGCPLFLPKADLMNGGFVKDDSIFIEIITS